MKHNKKTALTAAILTAAVSFTSCTGGDEEMQTVYGPPPTSATEEPSLSMQTEYGPPPVQDETTTAEPDNIAPTETSPIDMQVVYGPPSAIN